MNFAKKKLAKRKIKKNWLKIWLKKKQKKLAKKQWQKFCSTGNFQKNQDFWTKSQYLLKMSRVLHIKSHKKKRQIKKKNG